MRRRLVIAALVAAAVCSFGAPARADYVPAHSARAFGDSIGVNAYLSWLDTAYGDFPTLRSRLNELGVRYIRDGLCAACPYHIDRLQKLADDGIRANIIAGALSGGTAQMQQTLAGIKRDLIGSVIAIEAPNEPNLSGDSNWVADTRAYQQQLYAAVKGDPKLAHLPVLGPAIAYPANATQVGDLSPWLDRGNFHPYPGGAMPYYNLDLLRSQNAVESGSKPLVATEAGYHSDLTTTGGHLPASERAIGIYTPRLVLDGYREGIERTYIFQLADPWTDATKPPGVPLMDNRFGLLRSDLSRKPSFIALRNLLRAVDGDSAPVAAPGGLHLTIDGAGADVRDLLLRSADGSYALVLWRQVSVWDWSGRHDLYPAADHMSVALGDRIALARRFDPVDSDVEQQRWQDPDRVPVDVAGAPVVLRLTPAAAPGGHGHGRGGNGGSSSSRPSVRAKRLRACATSLGAATKPRCCATASSRRHGHRRKRLHRRRGRATWALSCSRPAHAAVRGKHRAGTAARARGSRAGRSG